MKNLFKFIIISFFIFIYTFSFCQGNLFNTFNRFGKKEELLKNDEKNIFINYTKSENNREKDLIEIEVDSPEMFVTENDFSKVFAEKVETLKFHAPLNRLSVTSKFGNRIHPVIGVVKFHAGIDLKAYYEPVYSVLKGKVIFVGNGKNEGFYVVIQHSENSKSIYCHLSKILVSKGQEVRKGEKIAISGNTGRSTGPHLHFAVKYKGKYLNPAYLFN